MSWLLKRKRPGYSKWGLWSLLKRLRFRGRQSRSRARKDSKEFQTKVKYNRQRQRSTARQMRLYKHFSMPNSLFIAILMYTPCIHYDQQGVVSIKHELRLSMPCMTLVILLCCACAQNILDSRCYCYWGELERAPHLQETFCGWYIYMFISCCYVVAKCNISHTD